MRQEFYVTDIYANLQFVQFDRADPERRLS